MQLDKLRLLADKVREFEYATVCNMGYNSYIVSETDVKGPYTNYENVYSGVLHKCKTSNHVSYIVATPKGLTEFITDSRYNIQSKDGGLVDVIHDIVDIIIKKYGITRYNEMVSYTDVSKIYFEKIRGRDGLYIVRTISILNHIDLGIWDDNNKKWILKGKYIAIYTEDNYIKANEYNTDSSISCRIYDYQGNDLIGHMYKDAKELCVNIFEVVDEDNKRCIIKSENNKAVKLTECKYSLINRRGNLILLYYRSDIDCDGLLCDVYSIKDGELLNDYYITKATINKGVLNVSGVRVLDDESVELIEESFNIEGD